MWILPQQLDITEYCLDTVNEAERFFMNQKSKVKDLFFKQRRSRMSSILLKCRGNTRSSIKCFWSHVNKTASSSVGIDMVLNDDQLHCTPEAIILHVENHLVRVFSGSKTSIPVQVKHSDPKPSTSRFDLNSDHHYPVVHRQSLA